VFSLRQNFPRVLSIGLSLALLICATALASDASAAWLPNGTPVPGLNPWNTDDDASIGLAPDDSGGAYLVSAADGYSARTTRIQHSGDLAEGWTPYGLMYTTPPYATFVPRVVSDGLGGAFVISPQLACVAHCHGDPTAMRAQRITSGGAISEGWPAEGIDFEGGVEGFPFAFLNSFGRRVLIPGGPGSAIVCWNSRQSYRSLLPTELRLQLVESSGVLPWGVGGVVIRSNAAIPFDHAIARDGHGGAFVFWRDERAPGLFAQHVSEDGTVLWASEGIPVASAPATLAGPPVAFGDGAGGAIVAWAGISGARSGVFAIRVSSKGSLLWRGDRLVFDAGLDHVDGLGGAPTGFGSAILAWRDSAAAGDVRVLAQRIDGLGRVSWRRAASVCSAEGNRDHIALAADRRGGAYVAWRDSRTDFALYAVRLTALGTVARGWQVDGSPICARLRSIWPPHQIAEIKAVEMIPATNSVRRHSAAQGDESGEDELEKDHGADSQSDSSEDVEGLGRGRREPGAILVWADSRNSGCEDYGACGVNAFAMLLEADGPATAPILPTTSVAADAPPSATQYSGMGSAKLKFAIGSRGGAHAMLFFSLPDMSPASLEVFDLQGRRLWSRDLSGLAAGDHEARVDAEAWIPSGVYLARLTQGHRIATTRMAVIR